MSEVKMFGGTGFMLNGNLVAAVSKRSLYLRVGKDRHRDALAWPGARPMEMRGRTMEGYVYIDPPVPTNHALKTWLDDAVAFVKTLPVKAAAAGLKEAQRTDGTVNVTGGPPPPGDRALAFFLRARGDLATNPLASSCRCSKGLRR